MGARSLGCDWKFRPMPGAAMNFTPPKQIIRPDFRQLHCIAGIIRIRFLPLILLVSCNHQVGVSWRHLSKNSWQLGHLSATR